MMGNLITSKQVISYAKWYLSNPLKHSTSIGYKPEDIKGVKKTIHYAESHPKALFFGPKSKNLQYRGCFCFEPKYDLTDHDDDNMSVSDYLSTLKEQKVVSYIGLIRQVKAMNRKIDRHNALVTAHNEVCNRHIRQIAKDAGLHHLNQSLYDDQATDLFIPLDPQLSDAVVHEADKVSSQFSSALMHDPKSFSVNEMTGRVYYHGVPVNAHGSIAYWASDKTPLHARVDISRIPHEPVFQHDINYSTLCALSPEEWRITRDHVTEPNEMADYKNFIQK